MHMPVVTVVMTVYNSSKTLERAYRSVIEQDYQNIELIIVDDASTDNSLALAERLISSGTNDKKVVLISNKKNYGTFVCRNYAITQATGEYFCFHDSDDAAEKNYISSLFTCLTNAAHRKIVVCKTNSRIPGRKNDVICAASSMFHSSLLDKIGFFDSVRFAADTEFRMRCQALLGQKSVFVLNKKLMKTYASKTSLTGRKDIGIFSKPRKTYVSNFRKFHRTMSKKTKFEFPLSVRKFPVEKESLIGCDVDLSSFTVVKKATTGLLVEPKPKPIKPTKQGMKITANMATIPARANIAKKAVRSIIRQVDVVRLYLNNFKEVPEFAKNNPKIEYIIGEKDLNASGKHFWGMNPNEYYFTIDDDIEYPPNYVKDHLDFLAKFDDRAIISLHGNILPETPFSPMFAHPRYIKYTCMSPLRFNYQTNLGGQGVSVRNTNIVKIDVNKFKFFNMDDIEVGIQAVEQNIPIIVRRHEGRGKYLKYNPPSVATLFQTHRNNDGDQVRRTNEVDWQFPAIEHSRGKVSVLMSAWKSKNYIEQAICSVLDQKLPKGMEIELIVGVDNCKETYEVVKKINDSRVGILFMNQNVGTYKTFNTMLKYASGDFIFRFDSDDILGEDCLYHALSHLIINPELTATQLRLVVMNEDMRKPLIPSWIKCPLTFRAAGQVLWRASDLRNKLGAYLPWTCAADTEILSRAKHMNLNIDHTELAYFCYRKHPHALTVKKDTSPRSQERKSNLSYIKLKEQSYGRGKFPEKAKLNSFPHTKSGLLFSNNSSIIVHNFSFDVISEINRARIDSKNFMKKKYR